VGKQAQNSAVLLHSQINEKKASQRKEKTEAQVVFLVTFLAAKK